MADKTVVVTGEPFPERVVRRLADAGLATRHLPGDLSPHAVRAELADAWGYVLGGSERMPDDTWAALPGLRAMCFLGTGYAGFLRPPAQRGETQFCYTPHANAPAVAEFTVALMLDLVRQSGARARGVGAGEWNQAVTPSLLGRRLGIVGLGHIGREVARMCAAAFGMSVGFYNRSPRPDAAGMGYTRHDDVATLCAHSDVVAVTCGYTPGDNDAMLGAKELAALGPAGWLVNIGGPQLVDVDALRTALENDTIAGAAFDGYWSEPAPKTPEDDPYGLLRLVPDRLIVTPHTATFSDQAFEAMVAMAVDNLVAVAAGQPAPFPIPRGDSPDVA